MTKASRDIRKLRNAAIEDVLAHLGIPVATSRTALKIFAPRWFWPEYYLQWGPRFSMDYYRAEIQRCLRLPVGKDPIPLPQVIELEAAAAATPMRYIKIVPSHRLFVPDNQIVGLTDRIFRRYRRFLRFRRRVYRNEQLLRLCEVRHEGDGTIILNVQPVQYEAVCRTHLCLDAEENPGAETVRKVVHPRGRLPPLSESRLAEPLGVNFLLLTADGRVVLPRRSNKVVVRPGALSPSFSGDFNFADVGTESRTLDSVQLLREGFEELNLFPEDVPHNGIAFLGLTRELVRGGKPEMFFVGQTSLTEREYRDRHLAAPDSWEFRRHGRNWMFWSFGEEALVESLNEDRRHVLRSRFEDLLRAVGPEMSLPLLTNLALWMRERLSHNANDVG